MEPDNDKKKEEPEPGRILEEPHNGFEENFEDAREDTTDEDEDNDNISKWVINAPDRVKIIGCGDYGVEIVDSMYINYAQKLAGLKRYNFNKPTKPDYLDLKLVPDYRNIRSAGIKKEVEDDLRSRDQERNRDGSGVGKKKTLIGRIKNVFGQKKEGAEYNGPAEIDNETGSGNKVPDSQTGSLDISDGIDEGNNEPVDRVRNEAIDLEDEEGNHDPRDLTIKKARAELVSELKEFLPDTDLLFIVTDLASPYGMDNSLTAAKIARDMDTITVGLVILPTKLDKLDEVEYGNRALQAFRLSVDIVVVVPDIEHIIEGYLVLTISELMELMTTSGLINLDVADIKTVVGGGNVAMIGFGAGFKKDGNKIMGAITEAVSSPILNVDLNGVNRTLVNVTGDSEMTISEAQKAARMILDKIQPDARLIWGAAINPALKGAIKVMVMAGVKPKNILVHIYANS